MQYPFTGFRCTKPKVVFLNEKDHTYQVQFFIYPFAGKRVPYRFSKGINNLKPSLRKSTAEDYAQAFWDGLQSGWNPLVVPYPAFELEKREQELFNLPRALDYCLGIKKPFLSKHSYPDYLGTVRFIKKAAAECSLTIQPVAKLERKDIRLIIATAKELNEWSSNARNKYLSLLKSLLTVLVDEDLIKFNPAHDIKDEPAQKGPGYSRLTEGEKERIARHLFQKVPHYFEYLLFIYQLGVRRTELLMIQLKDINLQRRQITIRAEVAKNNKQRMVPVTDDLFDILMGREIYSKPIEWYLFSSWKFLPGPRMFHPNTPTNWWRKYVIRSKDGGLGINCKMYSLKHKGADDKIDAGIPLDALKNLYGHHSKQMTEIYAASVRDKYQQMIIDNAPTFTAKVIQLKKAE